MAISAAAELVAGCVDPNGWPVIEVEYPPLNDIAMATIWMYAPAILYNPQRLAAEHPVFTRFVYIHECGHHVLGQILRAAQGAPLTMNDEVNADCFAVRQLLGSGEFGPQHIQFIQQRVFSSPGDATHPAGPQRATLIGQCAHSAVMSYSPSK